MELGAHPVKNNITIASMVFAFMGPPFVFGLDGDFAKIFMGYVIRTVEICQPLLKSPYRIIGSRKDKASLMEKGDGHTIMRFIF